MDSGAEMEGIDTAALSDRVCDRVRYELASGQLHPGERLIIRRLAQRYGISATPVREAIQRLVAEGSLSVTRARTAIVPDLSFEDFEEIRMIRHALEGMAANLAAPKVTDDDLDVLERLMADMYTDLKRTDLGMYLVHNEEFHSRIYSRAGSARLAALIDRYWMQVGPILNYLIGDSEFKQCGNEGHERILEAARRRAPEDLAAAVIADIDSAARILRKRHGIQGRGVEGE